jgi:membrane fusion protein (multidrug efflux system)
MQLNNIHMKKVLSLLIIVSLFVMSCGSKKVDKNAELAELKKQQSEISQKIKDIEKELGAQNKVSKQILVSVDTIVEKTFIHYLNIQGSVDATENVIANAKMPGTVTKIFVKEGAVVKTGQVIASTDASAMLSGLEEAKTGLAFATNIYEKQKKLWDQKIGTEFQYLQAKNSKEQAEKRIATLNEQIEMSQIVSPINGVVDEVMLKIGQPASPGMPGNGIRIVNLGSLKVKADVAETYSKYIKAGNEVIVELPDAEKTLKTTISYVSKSINNLTRTFNVEVLLPSSADYQANMMAILKIADYKAANTLSVPVNLVQNSDEGEYIFIASKEGNKTIAKKKTIKTGKLSGNDIEVLSGIQNNDLVISVGFQGLNDGDEILVK